MFDSPAPDGAETLTRRCASCGELLPARARFCGRCGQTLSHSPPHGTPPDLVAGAQPPLPEEKPAYLTGKPASVFTDVFISYSRKDKPFVRQLFQALNAASREAWVDWDDIPPTADWQQEIYKGIETASTFVFVLSPESISSGPCHKEIEYAVQNKKRIIPLLYRVVDVSQVHEALQKLNWIFFTQSELFDFAFQQLLFALDTDLAYWNQSARLLARTKEWEKQGKTRSSTLRGKELKEAEQWKQEGATKRPSPGPPTTDFILASSKQRKQSRMAAIALVLVFLLIAGTSAYFFLQLPPDPTLVTTINDSGTGSLRWASQNAPAGSTISFATSVRGSISLAHDLHIAKNLVIRGPGASLLAITARTPATDIPGNLAQTVIIDKSVTATIANLTFQSGVTNEGSLTLTYTTILGNTDPGGPDSGGGSGGGIYNAPAATLNLINSTVSGNTAAGEDGSGGGIYNDQRAMLTLTNSTISGNTALFGGGIWNNGTLTLTNSEVSGNTASESGGGIWNEIDAKLTLTNSTISGNTAMDLVSDGVSGVIGGGGGIFNLLGGMLTLTDSTVSDNTAVNGSGGGIYNNGTLTLTNSTVSGNISTDGEGGGILNKATLGDREPTSGFITFCTLYGNRATYGGGIASVEFDLDNQISPKDIKVILHNSIVAGNDSGSGYDIAGPLRSQGYNLLQNVDPGTVGSTDLSLLSNVDLAQYIGPLGKNGGPTETQQLLLPLHNEPANLAIDAIPLADCRITFNDPITDKAIIITSDQRGQPRPGKNKMRCDIGAYETQG